MMLILSIAAGGALGAVARHFAVVGANGLWPNFPYGTVIVNVMGSFLIGALLELMALKWQASPEARAFMVTGLLGGFTTFSAFSFDTLKLTETGQYVPALAYVAASVVLSLAAVFAAVHLMRGVLS